MVKMSDLISREDAIDAMYRLEAEDIETYGCSIPEGFDSKPAIEALKALPSEEPERKKGKWIKEDLSGYLTPGGNSIYHCSECGHTEGPWPHPRLTNFCPSCGADMRGE